MIAVEQEEWLIQTEDSVERLGDQIEAMRALLEDWLEYLMLQSQVHQYDQGRTYCAFCNGCSRRVRTRLILLS